MPRRAHVGEPTHPAGLGTNTFLGQTATCRGENLLGPSYSMPGRGASWVKLQHAGERSFLSQAAACRGEELLGLSCSTPGRGASWARPGSAPSVGPGRGANQQAGQRHLWLAGQHLLPPPPFSFICFPFGRQSSRATLDDYGDLETIDGIIELNLTDRPSDDESAAVEGEVLGGDVEEVLDSNGLKFLEVLVDLLRRFWILG
ncbi:hypothetical protein Droror1_Dr00022645 [Drosera rotundifolia]